MEIISASEAFEKFEKGELIQKPMSQEEVEVTQIKLGYYAEQKHRERGKNSMNQHGYFTQRMRQAT
ncbi:MAG: hypothetical protein J7K81_07795 [Methanophagales archaeon]|nr:hypothetical protein [Methanophagales archaeon]